MMHLKRLFREESGTTAVEYAVMLALILVACLSSIGFFGSGTDGSLKGTANRIGTALAS